MFHLDNNSGVSAMPPVGAVQSSAPRWYTEGGGGTPASYPGADWYNIVQAELLNLLSAYGITPNKSDFNQLQKAIEEAIKQKATASSALLTAIAALVTSADKMPYFTGKDKVAMTDLTGFARTLLGRSDAAGFLSDLQLRESFSGVVGQSRNARMSITTSSSTATFTADELIVETSTGQQYRLSAFNQTVDLGTAGAGGMDTGTVPATGYVALYAIYNPTSGASAILAVNATAARAPEIYGGTNMPAGFTASALASVWRVSSGQFVVGHQHNRHISLPLAVVYSTVTGVTTISGVSFAAAVPKNAVAINGYLTVYENQSGVGVELSLYSSTSGIGQLRANATVTGQTSAAIASGELHVIDSQSLYYNMPNTFSGQYGIGCTGYSF